MNQYYALIYLTDYLNTILQGAFFHSARSPYKNVCEVVFERSGNEDPVRLVFSSRPDEIALFAEHRGATVKRNTVRFFETLSGTPVTGVFLAHSDRIITIRMKGNEELQFRLFGPHANLLHLKQGRIAGSFRNRNSRSGEEVPERRTRADRQTGSRTDAESSAASGTPPAPGIRLPDENPGSLPASLTPRQLLLQTNPRFPRHLISPVLDHYRLEQADPGRIREVTLLLTRSMEERPGFRVLEDGRLCLIPPDLLPLPGDRVFDSVNEAIRAAWYETSRNRRLRQRLRTVRPELEKALRKTAGQLRDFPPEEELLKRADECETIGHLLMTRAHEEHPGAQTIDIPDLYEEGRIRTIPLRTGLSISDNAQACYDRAAGLRREVRESRGRREALRNRLSRLETLMESLEKIEGLRGLEQWMKEHEPELASLRIGQPGSRELSLPWRRAEIDGYEVWIGKNAAGNDRLTATAHKEDIWLHARGSAGSHVIIRMGNNPGMPPGQVIRKAASWAAWHSRQRGASLVPVMITKKKYVTKPRGAPPGTVRVQREKVEMVSPAKPDQS